MVFLYTLEWILYVLVIWGLATQVLIPLWRGAVLFPFWRAPRERLLQHQITEATQEAVESDLEQQLRQTQRRRKTRQGGSDGN